MRLDLRNLSNEVTALAHNTAERPLDRTSSWRISAAKTRETGGRINRRSRDHLDYIAEYGLETNQQSCLNFLLFIHADRPRSSRRSAVQRRAVPRDQRHVASSMLAQSLPARSSWAGCSGRFGKPPAEVSSSRRHAPGAVPRTHDAVVLAIPFTTLRNVRSISSGSGSRQEGRDRPARLRDERQADGRLQRPALD